jgi:hypothetical protein
MGVYFELLDGMTPPSGKITGQKKRLQIITNNSFYHKTRVYTRRSPKRSQNMQNKRKNCFSHSDVLF